MSQLKIYRISQEENNTWDTYDSAIVIAESEEQAAQIDPSYNPEYSWSVLWMVWPTDHHLRGWCSSTDKVKVEYIGEPKEGSVIGIICASYNAG